MIILEERCVLHEFVEKPVFTARESVLHEFSPYALLARPNPRKKPNGEKENMALPSRPLLRKLATALNLIKKDPSAFAITSEVLCEKLAEAYPEIASYSDQQVEDLLAEVGTGAAPAPAAAAKPQTAPKPAGVKAPVAKPPVPAKKAAPAPVVEEEELPAEAGEEEAAEEAPPAPAPKAAPKPAAKAPAPAAVAKPPAPATRQPVKAPAPAAAPAAAAQAVDLKPIIDRIDAIGKAGDKNGKALEAILGYLTWQYNSTVAEGEQVKSITEISW